MLPRKTKQDTSSSRSGEHSDGSVLVVRERGTRSRDEEMRSRFPLRLFPSEKTKQDASSSRSDEHSDGSLLVVNERGTRSRDEEMRRIFFVFYFNGGTPL